MDIKTVRYECLNVPFTETLKPVLHSEYLVQSVQYGSSNPITQNMPDLQTHLEFPVGVQSLEVVRPFTGERENEHTQLSGSKTMG